MTLVTVLHISRVTVLHISPVTVLHISRVTVLHISRVTVLHISRHPIISDMLVLQTSLAKTLILSQQGTTKTRNYYENVSQANDTHGRIKI